MEWFGYLLTYLLGLALCFLELFVPSGGLIGIGAALCIAFSLWGLFGVSKFLGTGCVLVTLVYVVLLVRWGFRRFRLDSNLAAGVATGRDVELATGMVGETGHAVTALRPSGVAQINGHRFDVVTQGGFLEVGAPVEVIAADGNRIQVRGC